MKGTALFAVLVLVVLGWLLPEAAQAQDWEKVKRNRPSPVQEFDYESPDRSAELQIGYPGVFATRLFFPITPRQYVGGGMTLLPGLTGIGAEYRIYAKRPRPERLGVRAGGGVTYYNLRDNGESANSVGVHVFVGTRYQTRSRFALSSDLGLLNTTGSENDPVDSFGIEKGMSSVYVNFNLAYTF